MNKVWFFIANPKTDNWNDTEDAEYWGRHDGYIPWGIPDKSIDLDNLRNVGKEDVILCYHAIDREIIGCSRCKKTYYDKNENDGHRHHIDISDIKHRNPIKLDKLKHIGFKFIDDYLDNPIPRGRSVVHVPRDDWEKFKKIWAEYHGC